MYQFVTMSLMQKVVDGFLYDPVSFSLKILPNLLMKISVYVSSKSFDRRMLAAFQVLIAMVY